MGYNVSNYGDETVYLNQHSKSACTKLYNKRKEILAHPFPGMLNNRDACRELQRYTTGLLRVEFVLRAPALKHLRLNNASEWSVTTAKELIKEKSKSLAVSRPVRYLPLPEAYHGWKRELKQTYRLWAQCNDLSTLFGNKTLQRRRRSLIEFGIDIRIPPPNDRTPYISIQSLLVSENMTFVPRFARRYSLFYLPLRI